MIGFIGLGDIGLPMAERLVELHGELIVWNRTVEKAAPLIARGAKLASSPVALIEECEVIGLCLTSHVPVEQIVRKFFEASRDGKRRVIVDLSTGAPDQARARAAEAAAFNIGWVDAPVSGGPQAAATGSLTIFVGGDRADVIAAAPLLNALAARQTHVGGVGAGQTVKLCNQMIVSCSMLVIAETVAMARAAGVDVERLPEALAGGFADSKPLQIFGPRMASRTFEPRLGAIELMAKDLGLALSLSSQASARTPVAELCADLYAAADSPTCDLSKLVDLFERN